MNTKEASTNEASINKVDELVIVHNWLSMTGSVAAMWIAWKKQQHICVRR